MHYFTLINRTAAEIDGSEIWMDHSMELEVLLIAWSYIECGTMLYMLYKTNQYHPNLTCLLKHLVIQYFFSMAVRLIQIAYMYKMDPNVDLRTNVVFISATLIRNWLVFIAFYFAPFAMFERTYATLKIQDYENNQRLYVGYVLAMSLHALCLLSAALFIFQIVPVWYHLGSFIIANVASLLICLANDYCNEKRFVSIALMGKESTNYSLSERFQLVENLKTAHLFKRGITFIVLFSICCSSFISAEVIENDPVVKNWMHMGFNYAALIYGIGLPASMFYYNDLWQKEMLRLWRKMNGFLYKKTGQVDVPSENRNSVKISLKNTRGEDMMPDRVCRLSTQRTIFQGEETDIYFHQLNKDWHSNRKISMNVTTA